MKRLRWPIGFAWALCVATIGSAAEAPAPRIQIALLLDTSNSMDGLIDQAKSQLWKIVNEFATAKKDGQAPLLEVALYEYGNNGLPESEGFIRLVLPLSNDLDKVSEQLFALRTNGGNEFCGAVIDRAVRDLAWSGDAGDLKAIFIAGNEPFTQGPVDFHKACPAAIAKGIIVNAIYCGPFDEGVQTHWKDGAVLADGAYSNIDQNQKAIAIEAPQDKRIAELGNKLNETYVPYGKHGNEGMTRQRVQDANAAGLGAAQAAQRQLSKKSGFYVNSDWDLVDAVREKKVKIEDVPDDELPEAMKKLAPADRAAYLAKKTEERAKIREELDKLEVDQKKYVAEEMKRLAKESKDDSFDESVIKTLRSQAEKKQFRLN